MNHNSALSPVNVTLLDLQSVKPLLESWLTAAALDAASVLTTVNPRVLHLLNQETLLMVLELGLECSVTALPKLKEPNTVELTDLERVARTYSSAVICVIHKSSWTFLLSVANCLTAT